MPEISGSSVVLWLVVFVTTLQGGCSLRRSGQRNCCPPYVSQKSSFSVSEKPTNSGVVADFNSLGDFGSLQDAAVDSEASAPTAKMDLQEALCSAARNSELAEVVEAQRQALLCRSEDGEESSLIVWLQGEALEQRNKSAGAAGQLFLGLVEVELQRKLLTESQEHLAEFAETLRVAADEGFATAVGANQLSAALLELQFKESALFSQQQLLRCQFNALVDNDSASLANVRPVYELKPTNLNLNLSAEIELAATNRPGICALETVRANGVNPAELLELVGQSDSCWGTQSTGQSIKQRFLWHQLKKRLLDRSESGPATQSSRDQLTRILESKQKQARTEAQLAFIKIQSSAERVALADEKIASLNDLASQLLAQQELDAGEAYLEINKNWTALQTVRSQQITAAIEHDTAIIALLQSQGKLVQECGYCLPTMAK